jgi:hypothetical protein
MNYEDEKFLQKIFLIEVVAGGRSRTAEPCVAGPSSYPLDHEVLVEKLILELPDELRGRIILTDSIPSPCRV